MSYLEMSTCAPLRHRTRIRDKQLFANELLHGAQATASSERQVAGVTKLVVQLRFHQ